MNHKIAGWVPMSVEAAQDISDVHRLNRDNLLARYLNEAMIGPVHGPRRPAWMEPDRPWADRIEWDVLPDLVNDVVDEAVEDALSGVY